VKKQLKIKTGAISRLWKEYSLYTKEEEQLRIKLEKLKKDDAEAWDIKNTTNMAEESKKMIKVTQGNLTKVVDELGKLVVYARANPDAFNESEELNKAEAAINEINI